MDHAKDIKPVKNLRYYLKECFTFLSVSYVVVFIVFALLQKEVIFHPAGGPILPLQAGLKDFETITLTTSDGEKLIGWYKKPAVKGNTILFFHGNGGNNAIYVNLVKTLEPLADGFLMIDYRGLWRLNRNTEY